MKRLFPAIALTALIMGSVIVSCDEDEKLTNDAKKTEQNDSTQTNPADTTQNPIDTTQINPIDTTQINPVDSGYVLSVSLPKADSLFLSEETSVMDDYEYYYIDTIRIAPFKLVHSVASWARAFGMGFTYSSLTDTITPGSDNNSAITGQGVSSNAYFTVNTGGDMWGIDTQITFEDGKAYVAQECYVTNSTYAYLAIRDQNDGGFGGVKEWTDTDWFTLTITGYYHDEVTESVIVVLAEGDDILNTWKKVDLTKLGKVDCIKFSLDSTDQGSWGMNTPSYFCLDQLKVTEPQEK